MVGCTVGTLYDKYQAGCELKAGVLGGDGVKFRDMATPCKPPHLGSNKAGK